MDADNERSHDLSNGIYANYLHDLESMFWILIWTMSKYQMETTKGIDPELIISQKEIRDILFSQKDGAKTSRELFLKNDSTFEKRLDLIPNYYEDLKKLARSFREHLYGAYREEEKNMKADGLIKPSEGSVHLSILETFKTTKIDEYRVIPINYAELESTPTKSPQSLKRPTSNDDLEKKQRKKAK